MDGGKAFIALCIAIPLAIAFGPNLFYTPSDHKVYREGPDGKMVEVVNSQSSSAAQSSQYQYNNGYNGSNYNPDKSMYENMADNGYLKFPKALEESGYTSSSNKGPGREYYIKGNISYSTGEKIYHLPGDEYYDETVIDESAGERWFSSEEEAQAAGWRHAYC